MSTTPHRESDGMTPPADPDPSDCPSASTTKGDLSPYHSEELQLETDDELQLSYQNPEPPRELVDRNLIDADNIGQTVFSKHWLFTTLMKLLQVVECDADVGDGDSSTCVELEESLQDDLCKLWDMSMNQEVVSFMMEFKLIELLIGVISKSRAPRATEICVGVLGNMACLPSVCKEMGSNTKLVELLLNLLETPDAPTLNETMRLLCVCVNRLLCVCVSSSESTRWISAIKETPHVITSVHFILQSSTNHDLLRNTTEFVAKLMETDEQICCQWSTADLVLAVMEAVKQTGSHSSLMLNEFLRVLHLVSTSEIGVQALISYSGEVCMLILGYLMDIAIDDIVGVDGREGIIASALSILSVIFTVWEGHADLLRTDFQLVRCTLKILDVVYPRHQKLPEGRRSTRVRSGSIAGSLNGDAAANENNPNNAGDMTGVRRSSNNSVDISSDAVRSAAERDNRCSTSKAEIGTLTYDSSLEEPETASVQPSSSTSVELSAVSSNNSQTAVPDEKSKPVDDVGLEAKLSLERNTVLVTDDTGCPVSSSGQVATGDSAEGGKEKEAAEDEYSETLTEALYTALQDLLGEIICALSQLPVIENVEKEEQKLDSGPVDQSGQPIVTTPMSLVYLDSLCDRSRLEYLLATLQAAGDQGSLVDKLHATAAKHALKRLSRIINDTRLKQ